jgi:hypothetical protein
MNDSEILKNLNKDESDEENISALDKLNNESDRHHHVYKPMIKTLKPDKLQKGKEEPVYEIKFL